MPNMKNLVAMVAGGVVGNQVHHKLLAQIEQTNRPLFKTGNYVLTMDDLISILGGVLVTFILGKRSALIKWFGAGWLTYVLAFEVGEAIGL